MLRWVLALVVLGVWGVSSCAGQTGKTFTVNVLGDAADPNAGEPGDDGLCDVDPATPGEQCTLRAAIQNHNANRHLDHNTILINIPGVEPRILVTSPLPPVLGSVTIHGTNLGGPGRLEIDGSMAGSGAIGLQLLGADCVVDFVIIHSFSSHGIFIAGTPPPGGGGHRLEFNRIGTDQTGMVAKGNGGDGILIEDTPNNVIGGAGFSKRNVISGNGGWGVHVLGRDPANTGSPNSGAPNNRIEGNLIGFDAFEGTPMPNALGGVFIDNARDVTVGGNEEPKANKVSGPGTGIKVEGSLAGGIEILGNFIGKDGFGQKFEVGILSRGKLIRIEGNVITQVAGVGVDAFLDAAGTYNIKDNEFNGKMTIGTKLTFAEGRVITVEYRNNVHAGNDKGVQFEESLHGTINWNVVGNFGCLGTNGGSIAIKASGNKNFENNTWELNAQAGFRFVADVDESVRSIVTVTGEVYDKNGLEGVGIKATVRGELTYVFLRTKNSENKKDGILIEAFAAAEARFDWSGAEMDVIGNLEAGIRAVTGGGVVPFVSVHIERSFITGNVKDGAALFGVELRRTIVDNEITNNGGAGIRLGSDSDARILRNTISGNGIGILVEDLAVATITENTISANGTGIALAGSAGGLFMLQNSITGSALLGIDLGNDGPTPNDALDADSGPNGLQNAPELASAFLAPGEITIAGSLHSAPDGSYRIDFYSNAACHPSGFGEGETWMGFTVVTTDAAGNAAFSAVISGVPVAEGAAVTATASGPDNSTSEFSACVAAGPPPADLELRKTVDDPAPAFGGVVTFTLTLSNVGPADAAGVVVSDRLPAGFSLVSASTAAGAYDAGAGTWTVGSLAAGSGVTLTLIAVVEHEGPIANTAEVTASGTPDPDSTPGNQVAGEDDQASVVVTVQPAAPAGRVARLEGLVDEAVGDGALTAERGEALEALLEDALAHFDAHHRNTAIARVRAFLAEVDALVSGGFLAAERALVLTSAAQNFLQHLPAGGLSNLSTRAQVGTGFGELIAGFVVNGTRPKELLIRAVGPGLSPFGVPGVLGDPVVELRQGESSLAVGDDWEESDGASIALVSDPLGAFPLEPGSPDAALLHAAAPGEYTAVVSGKQGTTGLALAEVYDATAPGETSAVERLVNISTRGQVGQGDGIIIAGFVVAGTNPVTVLLRGVGPGLAPFGVGGVLDDPLLELYQGSEKIGGNDDWGAGGSADAIRSAAVLVGAFALEEGGRDAALLATLAPGVYTLHLSGKGPASGVALAEIYEL